MHYWSIYRKANNTCSEQPKSKTHLITVEVKKSIVAARRSWQTALLLDACYQLLVILDSVLENPKWVRWWLSPHLISSPETFGTLALASTDCDLNLVGLSIVAWPWSYTPNSFICFQPWDTNLRLRSVLYIWWLPFLLKKYLFSWTMITLEWLFV